MRYYFYVPDTRRYDGIQPADLNWDPFDPDLLGGRRLLDRWTPIRVRWEPADDPVERQPRVDLTDIHTHVPVFSERALHLLEPLLGASIEALPLECPDQKMFAIHVLDVIDCLDPERSEVERFEAGGQVMRVRKYVFKEDRLQGKHIFRIPDLRCCRPFVSERFREEVEKHGLVGLIFTGEWFGEELV